MKFIVKMGDRRFRDRLMKDAASVLPIASAEFDATPYLINCKNGTFDLEKMEFREHDWKDFLTMQTNFNYTLQDARCRRWEKFVAEVTCNDEDKADYLQKALGYSMLGMANEECMFILHGKTTRNGKSTMLSAIHHLLGDYASVSPVSIICKAERSKNAEAANPMLASLKGKRFVTMAESNQYGKLDEETIKQLTGGEEIKARNLYETATTFLPQFTLWLSCNDLPTVSDKSLFASDRVRVIEFNRHFTEAEQDKNLKNEFQTQEAMQGIFAWLVAGYFKYKRFGLPLCGRWSISTSVTTIFACSSSKNAVSRPRVSTLARSPCLTLTRFGASPTGTLPVLPSGSTPTWKRTLSGMAARSCIRAIPSTRTSA